MKQVATWVVVALSAALFCNLAFSADQVDMSRVSSIGHDRISSESKPDVSDAAESIDIVIPPYASAMARSGFVLKVYIVEPVSRWTDNSAYFRWGFGFLDFLHDTVLTLDYLETFQQTRVWRGSDNSFLDTSIHQDNIMAIAVVFDTTRTGYGYSNPPGSARFDIHPVLAAAAATPGNPGYDTAWGSSTHTMFIEDASTTWCPNCPYTRQTLHDIYASGNYNFLYTTMVIDRPPNYPLLNGVAVNWMDDAYNVYYVPTCYFDGGYRVFIGGTLVDDSLTKRITACGERSVPAIDLDVSLDWPGDSTIVVTVTLKNNQFVNHAPGTPATPSGPNSGLLESEHTFSTSVTDLDADQLYYMWDWGNEITDWTGPYNSGETVNVAHTWASFGTYSVKIKAKDPYDYESPWSAAANIKVAARGDANSDGAVNVGDGVFLIGYVFKGGAAPDPLSAGDANCDGASNIGDAVYMIAYVFRGGPPPGCPE